MRRTTAILLAAVVVAVLSAGAAVLMRRGRGAAAPPLAIQGATVIDGTGHPPIPDAVVVVRGSRIDAVGRRGEVQVPRDAVILDAGGKFVVPGLSDMNNHLRSGTSSGREDMAGNLIFSTAWGITAVFAPGIDVDSFASLKRASGADSAPAAHFFSSGPVFTPAGSSSDFAPRTSEEARIDVRTLKSRGVDAIKLFYDDMSWLTSRRLPVFPLPIVAAIVDEAHRQGLKVYVDAPIFEYARDALRAGVDGLLQGVLTAPVDDQFIGLMRKNHAIYVASLALFESAAGGPAWVQREAEFDKRGLIPRQYYDRLLSQESREQWNTSWDRHAQVEAQLPILRENLRRTFAAGVPIATGTDAGTRGVVLGVSEQLELRLHVEAGIPAMATLQAATINAARILGRERELGSIEPGKLADLLILEGDPLADVSNTANIDRVVKGGVVYTQEQLGARARGQ